MDTFDLKWPQSDATFYTDGWRCRIVWREKRGGLGGTIDNNDQCKRRVADSLGGAPYLLSALRARGHGMLATEIEALAGAAGAAGAAEAVVEAAPIDSWVHGLPGSGEFQAVASGRAKAWHPCGELDDECLLLKAPTPRGKQEWLLKRTWEGSKRKAEYVAAPELRGICEYLLERGLFADAAAVEGWLGALEEVGHEALAAAATAWRQATETATH